MKWCLAEVARGSRHEVEVPLLLDPVQVFAPPRADLFPEVPRMYCPARVLPPRAAL